ncbi:PTS sugar transporter subunit IIC [Enterococcus mundtii]|uniref:Permease IIC component n=1 Tax=Enterococcus mundtii TaxID=53346 RepID=A0ABQ0VBB0_ENTMU|nr:PTS transporter subunit EIIC [Enterococcus mundtii]GEN17065.1 permease IIC component [Ligilactobacillus acidipiscis]AUB54262.1 PTS cellobiose transporter subunit IIC [Enterococcus mundtii]MZZ58858.1 PTS transporter subunit EIIC [Enterococcus mundtii]MZZ61789.1 PTS transporter subunit EIIC [Enterococcus mundtii]MZZ68937.1 PTS transporter subunit EIIC [Enterococcus mundtii]
MDEKKREALMGKFVLTAQKIGNQVYLRTLRDSFATIMPLFILAGIAILINSVVLDPSGWFQNMISADTMASWQNWGSIITNSTLNITGIILVITIGYFLSKNREYDNPIGVVIAVVPAFLTLLPTMIETTPINGETAVEISGVISYGNIGSKGVFAAIITGLLATELYIRLTRSKKLQVNLGDSVPPAVGKSFNTMFPLIIVVSLFAFASFLIQLTGNDFMRIIEQFIQEPLRGVGTSFIGYLFLVCFGNLLFSFGIHQSVITGPILDPLLMVNMNENMAATANGEAAPHIINSAFHQVYGALMGGTGSTIALVIAILIFSRYQAYKDLSKLALGPNIFNINEPVIFGLPIVFNLPMIIPFVLSPIIGTTIGYLATSMQLVNRCVVPIPWTTPPFLSGFLATAGDWRAIVVQAVIIVALVFFYLPFLKISERVARTNAEMSLS